MPVFIVNPRSGELCASYVTSPRIAISVERPEIEVPPEIRIAADEVVVSPGHNLPEGMDGVLYWHEGDRLAHAPDVPLRHELIECRSELFVPVHIPCLPEIDLIGLRPLFGVRQPECTCIDTRWRVGAEAASPRLNHLLLHNAGERWAILLQELFRGSLEPLQAIPGLAQLWKTNPPPVLAALTLRNIVVLLWKAGRGDEGDSLLRAGIEQYPRYTELTWLLALRKIAQSEFGEARRLLESIFSAPASSQSKDAEFVGTGGEDSYRAQWMLSRLAGDDQSGRFDFLLSASRYRPAFPPVIHSLLSENVEIGIIENLRWDLRRLVRRERQYLRPVLDFLLRHRDFPTAQILIDTLGLSADVQAGLQQKLDAARHSALSDPASLGRRLVLDGPFLDGSKHAATNEELTVRLLDSGATGFSVVRRGLYQAGATQSRHFTQLRPYLNCPPAHLPPPQLLVVNRSTPAFPALDESKVAIMLSWESAAMPCAWREKIETYIDEVWVPSRWTRANLLQLGVPSERVCILPPAVDPDFWSPADGGWWPSPDAGFRFLFLGNPHENHGADLLLKAFSLAFRSDDHVSLVLQTELAPSAYLPVPQLKQMRALIDAREITRVHLLTSIAMDEQRLRLLRACDAVVLPYRAEDSGLSILRAMSCGKPVITSDRAYIRELVLPQQAVLVPGSEKELVWPEVNREPHSAPVTWFEPDLPALAASLRHMYESSAEWKARGLQAREHVLQHFNWSSRICEYQQRIEAILSAPGRSPRCGTAGA